MLAAGIAHDLNNVLTPILMGARKRTHEIFGDFIDRYRALGGRREATEVEGTVIVRAWNEDTPEADELWIKTMAGLGNLLQREVATCLLERGRL